MQQAAQDPWLGERAVHGAVEAATELQLHCVVSLMGLVLMAVTSMQLSIALLLLLVVVCAVFVRSTLDNLLVLRHATAFADSDAVVVLVLALASCETHQPDWRGV